jgi:hypothetical protein
VPSPIPLPDLPPVHVPQPPAPVPDEPAEPEPGTPGEPPRPAPGEPVPLAETNGGLVDPRVLRPGPGDPLAG